MEIPEKLAEIRRQAAANGINWSEWARKQGFKTSNVYNTLHGKAQGKRGQARKILSALNVIDDASSFDPASVFAEKHSNGSADI